MAKSKKDSGYVDNWQTGKTVIECNLHMLTTEDCSDVIFRVGSEKHVVRAHRYVLVSRSCVFHAMFCGPLAEKGEITIPDIEPDVFKEFLRYVYTDKTTLTADTVTGLLYTSRKYAVDALQEMCVTFLEKSLSEDNVCQILEHCHGYGESDLEQKALKILTTAGVKVIKSPGFVELCPDCLSKLLKSDELNLKEEEIFDAVLLWVKSKCQRESMKSTPENLKKILGELRYEIRFTDVSLEYLVNVVRPSGMLTDSERVAFMDKKVSVSIDISPFTDRPRRRKEVADPKSPPCCVERYSTILYKPRSIVGKEEAISFSVSKNISLVGCQLNGAYAQERSVFMLNVVLYDDQDQVICHPVSNTSRSLLSATNDIFFPIPVSIQAGHTYTIGVTMAGADTYYKGGGRSSVTVEGVKFNFSNSKRSKGTTVSEGHIPGLIWRL